MVLISDTELDFDHCMVGAKRFDPLFAFRVFSIGIYFGNLPQYNAGH